MAKIAQPTVVQNQKQGGKSGPLGFLTPIVSTINPTAGMFLGGLDYLTTGSTQGLDSIKNMAMGKGMESLFGGGQQIPPFQQPNAMQLYQQGQPMFGQQGQQGNQIPPFGGGSMFGQGLM